MPCCAYMSVAISGAKTRSSSRPEAGVNDSEGLDSGSRTPVAQPSGSHGAVDLAPSPAVRSRRVPRPVPTRPLTNDGNSSAAELLGSATDLWHEMPTPQGSGRADAPPASVHFRQDSRLRRTRACASAPRASALTRPESR
jgi:hypothetical protein